MADPLVALARRLARKAGPGRPVPTPNPDGPTTKALALFVLIDPGATLDSGASKTGITDPFVNDDPTAKRTQRLVRAAKIDPAACVWWNASPYHLGYRPNKRLRPADHEFGVYALRQVLERCRDLRVVVAMGEPAWPVVNEVWTEQAPSASHQDLASADARTGSPRTPLAAGRRTSVGRRASCAADRRCLAANVVAGLPAALSLRYGAARLRQALVRETPSEGRPQSVALMSQRG